MFVDRINPFNFFADFSLRFIRAEYIAKYALRMGQNIRNRK